MTETATKETLGFQAEVKQLLHLMVHSLYGNKEIFLRELVSNASDAGDKLRFEAMTDAALYESDPDPKIRVSVDPQARTITVSDNGIGIPQEFADKVFVIFQRLHGGDVYSGTGIGLALCKKIIEHHGGTIWIDTSHTEGTRFRFTLPMESTIEPDQDPAAVLEGASE